MLNVYRRHFLFRPLFGLPCTYFVHGLVMLPFPLLLPLPFPLPKHFFVGHSSLEWSCWLMASAFILGILFAFFSPSHFHIHFHLFPSWLVLCVTLHCLLHLIMPRGPCDIYVIALPPSEWVSEWWLRPAGDCSERYTCVYPRAFRPYAIPNGLQLPGKALR